jgi:hypothetical protein
MPEPVDHGGHELLAGGAVPHVAALLQGTGGGIEVADRGSEPGRVAGTGRHLCSLLHQRLDGGQTDPRTVAGHDDDSAGQPEIHIVTLPFQRQPGQCPCGSA